MAKKQSQISHNNLSDTEGRVPPQAVEVEEAVLGSMLIDHDAAVIGLDRLQGEDFYKASHREIFDAIRTLFDGDNPLDILTVENELRDREKLEVCGGPSYLSYLTRSVSSSASIEYHAQIIKEKSIKRKLIATCSEIIGSSYDTASDPMDLLDSAETALFNLSTTGTRSNARLVKDLVKSTLEHLEELRGKSTGITGVPTLLDVDEMTSGWQRGDMIIIAARPSMGKTAFVLTAARNAALNPDVEQRTPVAVFSLEMSNQSLVQRLLTMEARVDAQSARSGKLKQEEFQRLMQAAGRLYEAEIYIDDSPSISIMELRTKCRRLKSENDIGLVIVDYLQLMTGGPGFEKNREQEIAFISRGLKALAKDLDVPVIALSQLSRAVEQRTGEKRPQLSDLRESGSIEQDADVVCFLYRPEYYGMQTDSEGRSTEGIAELIIGKQRNGPVGTVRMQFVKQYARFENAAFDYPTGYLQGQQDVKHSLAEDSVAQLNQQYGRPKDDGASSPDETAPF